MYILPFSVVFSACSPVDDRALGKVTFFFPIQTQPLWFTSAAVTSPSVFKNDG